MPLLPGSDPAAVERAAALLAQGALVAFPTETVYGLGARADDDGAVAGIFNAKGRPTGHPLIVHVADTAAALAFTPSLGPHARALVQAFWPGPLTVIVPRRAGMADAAAGGQDSIGLRMPSHPVALALLQAASRRGVAGLAGPSANRFGRVSPTTAPHVEQEFGPSLAVLDGGPCEVGIESAIVDCTGAEPTLLRPGRLPRDAIETVLGRRLAQPRPEGPRAPGTMASHYAPKAQVRLFDPPLPFDAPTQGRGSAAVYSRVNPTGPGWLHQAMPDDAGAVARELFAVLRDLDATGVGTIWVQRPPAGQQWDGVRDRLERAAASGV